MNIKLAIVLVCVILAATTLVVVQRNTSSSATRYSRELSNDVPEPRQGSRDYEVPEELTILGQKQAGRKTE